MKKLNTTYLDNLVSKILKETLEEKADTLISKIKGDVCECGGTMYEGECNECGNMYEDMSEGIYDVDKTLDDEFDYVGESEDFDDSQRYDDDDDEDREKTCQYHIDNFGKNDSVTQKMCQGVNIRESLRGRQGRLGKNNKIDAEDLRILRKSEYNEGKKSETDEGNAFTGALSKARKTGDKDFEVDGKKFETKEGKKFPDLTGDGKVTRKDILVGRGVNLKNSKVDKDIKKVNKISKTHGMEENLKKSYKLTENEMVNLIEKIVKEEKDKTNIKVVGGSPKGLEKYKQIHALDGKENDEYLKSVTKKMKEYLKDGSKGDYDMNPKMFPKGNGELEKMKKKAYTMSDAGKEFIDDFMSPGMENLDYDQIEPNEEQITANIEGSSKTGNDSSYANAVETDVNKKINAKRKANKFAKARTMAYQKAPQPIKDATGEDSGKGVNIKLESTEDKKIKQINEEFGRMKSLIGYNRKTQ
jgi:hypothetical protein